MALSVRGQVLDITAQSGTFTNEAGENVPYDSVTLHVLAGLEVHKVAVPRDMRGALDSIEKGDQVDLEVRAFSQKAIKYNLSAVNALV